MQNSLKNKTHIPVMLNESILNLNIAPDRFYIDCTLGEGGHSFEIYSKLNQEGILLSIDRDYSAIQFVKNEYKEISLAITTKENYKEIKNNKPLWILYESNYSKISNAISNPEINAILKNKKAAGILMDLGLSSRQLEIEKRGFSYIEESQPLDMRMEQSLSVTAKDLLNGLLEYELVKLFRLYGEERFAGPIAKTIKANLSQINNVGDLVQIIYKVIPKKLILADKHHPARRVFQALRIAVNDEMNSLTQGIDNAFEILDTKGRLVIITFHSLEDRIVKNMFDELSKNNKGILISKKPIMPTDEEIRKNVRAHSAKMRVIEKI